MAPLPPSSFLQVLFTAEDDYVQVEVGGNLIPGLYDLELLDACGVPIRVDCFH
jgi:hypothetical protein